MVMTYEQWQIILGVIDQEVNLSKDNVVEKIKKTLERPRVLETPEISRMLEEVSHELSKSTRDTRATKKETKGAKCTTNTKRSKKDTKGDRDIKCTKGGKKNTKKIGCKRDIRRIKSSGARGCARCTKDLRKGTSDARRTKDARDTRGTKESKWKCV